MATESTTVRQIGWLGLAAFGTLLALPALMMTLGVGWGGGMMTTTMHGGGMTGGWAMGWAALVPLAVLLLFVVALAAAGVVAYRGVTASAASDPALVELRSAYARGDLTDEEFERRRERLERDG